MLKRKVPYVPPVSGEVDKRTVYLEPVPPEADSTYVTNLLKSCGGKILYVSLPRFKKSRQLKGFAFVEFDCESVAKKACDLYAPKQDSDSGLAKFPNTNKQLESLRKRSFGVCDIEDNNDGDGAKNGKSETSDFSQFWVISKKKWGELKKEYLKVQKDRIETLKAVVAGEKFEKDDGKAKETKAKSTKRKTGDRKSPEECNVKPKHIKFSDDNDDESVSKDGGQDGKEKKEEVKRKKKK